MIINIEDLIGVRYRLNGRSIKTGLDCYGLAIEVSKRFGHELPDLEDVKKKDRDFMSCENKILKNIKVSQIEEPSKASDILLIKGLDGVFHHIGVYLGNGWFIHCNQMGVHLDRVSQYKNLIGRVYQWQE